MKSSEKSSKKQLRKEKEQLAMNAKLYDLEKQEVLATRKKLADEEELEKGRRMWLCSGSPWEDEEEEEEEDDEEDDSEFDENFDEDGGAGAALSVNEREIKMAKKLMQKVRNSKTPPKDRKLSRIQRIERDVDEFTD